jgi:hypothetical protein
MGFQDVNDTARAQGPEGVRNRSDGARPSRKPSADVRPTPATLAEVNAAFRKWLALKDLTPVHAVLGAVAGNLLPGEPVWLGLIAPPSSAKTEILQSISCLPDVVQATTLTAAGLLSGTPKRQRDKTAKGGLLRQIGAFGIIAVKDFGGILSMHPETRGELVAMLRETYDGAVVRHLGVDGGKTLSWEGKVGVLFAATPVIDTFYNVLASMGDRFLFSRLAPVAKGQGPRALGHRGKTAEDMRRELSAAVLGLFAGRRAEPRDINDDEIARMERTVLLAVRLRGSIARDRQSREIEAVYGAEGPARLMLTLERLLAGLDTLGVERETALAVVDRIAFDSTPPTRLAAYRYVEEYGGDDVGTAAVATALGLPTITARRALEEIAAYRLIDRQSQGQGKSDLWRLRGWEQDP